MLTRAHTAPRLSGANEGSEILKIEETRFNTFLFKANLDQAKPPTSGRHLKYMACKSAWIHASSAVKTAPSVTAISEHRCSDRRISQGTQTQAVIDDNINNNKINATN